MYFAVNYIVQHLQMIVNKIRQNVT